MEDEIRGFQVEMVDLSGMSLDSHPSTSISLAAICKLDLSNNNLQSIPESLTVRLLNMMVLDVHSNSSSLSQYFPIVISEGYRRRLIEIIGGSLGYFKGPADASVVALEHNQLGDEQEIQVLPKFDTMLLDTPDNFKNERARKGLRGYNLSSKIKVVGVKNRNEASIMIWKRKMNQRDCKASWL
ncbi:hypothetical protein SASPL_145685 [Salvia splendens]|uniref:Uncharacterized protein n=1 Tax=Salvia splendens TaxID=180675 RepID=A0A8X8WHH6_SALSN|nr:hypothetical protein SASPL_145685 [Salvia splendens]